MERPVEFRALGSIDGSVDVLEGRLAEGRISLKDALARARNTEQEGQVAIVLRELALLARAEGEIDAARHLLERSAEMLEGLDRGGDLGGRSRAWGSCSCPVSRKPRASSSPARSRSTGTAAICGERPGCWRASRGSRSRTATPIAASS